MYGHNISSQKTGFYYYYFYYQMLLGFSSYLKNAWSCHIYIIIVIASLDKSLLELRGFTVQAVIFIWAEPTRILYIH